MTSYTTKTAEYFRYLRVGLFVITTAAGIIVLASLFKASDPSPVRFITHPPAQGMAVVASEEVELPVPLKVFPKKEAVKKMKLPAAIAEDPAKQITATANLKPATGDYTVVAVVDTNTGTTVLTVREEPRPFLGFGGVTEVGALGGVTTRGDSALVFVRQDLLRVGDVHLFAAGGAGVMGDSFGAGVFVGASVRW